MRHRRHLVAFEDEVRAALEEAADLGGALRAARAVLVRDDVVREDVRLALAVVGEGVGVELLPADGDVLDLRSIGPVAVGCSFRLRLRPEPEPDASEDEYAII